MKWISYKLYSIIYLYKRRCYHISIIYRISKNRKLNCHCPTTYHYLSSLCYQITRFSMKHHASVKWCMPIFAFNFSVYVRMTRWYFAPLLKSVKITMAIIITTCYDSNHQLHVISAFDMQKDSKFSTWYMLDLIYFPMISIHTIGSRKALVLKDSQKFEERTIFANNTE